MINMLFFISLIVVFVPFIFRPNKMISDKWFTSKTIFVFFPALIILILLPVHQNLKLVLLFNCAFSLVFFIKKAKPYKILLTTVHFFICLILLKYLWPSDISRASLAALNIMISCLCIFFLDVFSCIVKKNILLYLNFFFLVILILYNAFMFFELAF